MSDVFDEVNEELRKERMEALAKKYAPFVIGVVVAVLAVVIGNQLYTNYVIDAANKDGDIMLSAVDNAGADGGDVNSEEQLLSLVAEGSGAYPEMAKLRLASDFANAGNTEEAIRLYDEVMASAPAPELTQVALMRKAYILLDKSDYATLKEMLSSVDGMWRPLADEVLAVAAFNASDYETAAAHYFDIASQASISNGLRQRADKGLSVLASKGVFPNDTSSSNNE